MSRPRPLERLLCLAAAGALACAPEDPPATDTDTEPVVDTEVSDTDLPEESDTEPVVDTDSDAHSDMPVHTDSDDPVDTEVDSPVDTDINPALQCQRGLDAIDSTFPPPFRTDVDTIGAFEAWLCDDDPIRAAACPPAHQPCANSPGTNWTSLAVIPGSERADRAYYDGAGSLVAYVMVSDIDEFCDNTASRIEFGAELVHGSPCWALVLTSWDPPVCGPALPCTSTP